MIQNLIKVPVVVAGGGIAGLSFANACQEFGFKSLVLEKAKEYKSNVGQGIGLWGPALMNLRQIGLEDQLQKQGRYMFCAGYQTRLNTKGWLVKPSVNLRRLTSCLCIKRSSLQNSLYENYDKNYLKMNSQIKDYEQQDKGVLISLESGEQILCDMLIGADGINSVIRKKIHPQMFPEFSGYYYYQGITKNPEASSKPAYEIWGPKQRFGVIGLQDPDVFWFGATENDLQNTYQYPKISGAKAIDHNLKEKLLESYKDFGEEIQEIIKQTDVDYMWTYISTLKM